MKEAGVPLHFTVYVFIYHFTPAVGRKISRTRHEEKKLNPEVRTYSLGGAGLHQFFKSLHHVKT